MTLIIGANGQLGWELTQLMPDATALTREELDVTDLNSMRMLIQHEEPEVVINCTAYNAVDDAETNRDEAILLNTLVPAAMAAAARNVDAKFIHFSTDYVFGDGHQDPIDESHVPQPQSAYARSKWAGEQRVMQNHPGAIVMRLTGVYSHRRNNFVKTMVKHALKGTELKVVNDQSISPTWARSIAMTVEDLMEYNLPGGVIHCVSDMGCTWYTFASKIFEILDIEADLHAVSQADWGAAAARPEYSILDNSVLRSLNANEHMTPWDEMLEAFLKEYGEALISELEG